MNINKQHQSRRWCFTINNYTDQDVKDVLKWECNYVVVGREVGAKCLTPHLQGFVTFKTPKRFSAVKKLKEGHWEPAKGTSAQAADYCKKAKNFEEVGVVPYSGRRTDLQKATAIIRDSGSLKEVSDECPETYVKYSRGLRDYALLQIPSYDHDAVRGIWISGSPGTGKTHAARMYDSSAYMKAQNKWWDGYIGQETVILDDLDTDKLAHYLKIWSDKWSCTGETKGGTVQLQHTLFIVTSNFTIEELFKDQSDETIRALIRRFKSVYKDSVDSDVDFSSTTKVLTESNLLN